MAEISIENVTKEFSGGPHMTEVVLGIRPDSFAAAAAAERSLRRVHAGTKTRPGAPLQLAVDPTGFHFFDPGSGRALSILDESTRDRAIAHSSLQT